jgi:hypothetical protein
VELFKTFKDITKELQDTAGSSFAEEPSVYNPVQFAEYQGSLFTLRKTPKAQIIQSASQAVII